MLAFTLFVAIWPQGCPAEQFEVGLPAFLEDVLGVIFGVVDGEVFRLEGSDELRSGLDLLFALLSLRYMYVLFTCIVIV